MLFVLGYGSVAGNVHPSSGIDMINASLAVCTNSNTHFLRLRYSASRYHFLLLGKVNTVMTAIVGVYSYLIFLPNYYVAIGSAGAC